MTTLVKIISIENKDLILHNALIRGYSVVDCLLRYTDYDIKNLDSLNTDEQIDTLIKFIKKRMDRLEDRTLFSIESGYETFYSNNVKDEIFD